MPIILAIEPDRRQAVHLTGVVRHRVGAELVLADTTEGALDAIGNRVPDLVLVPALLSPQDDAALAAALRVIAAAAHVRTLTIPVLASERRARPAPRAGILGLWRRERSGVPAPDGCDPAVFAEQIAAYLKEAAADRAELSVAPEATVEDVSAHAVAVNDLVVADAPAGGVLTEGTVIEQSNKTVIEQSGETAIEQLVIHAGTGDNAGERAVIEDAVIEHAVTENAAGRDMAVAAPFEPDISLEEDIDLSAELDSVGTEDELFDREPVGVSVVLTAVDEPLVIAAPVAKEDDVPGNPVDTANPVDPAVEDPWISDYLSPRCLWPALEGVSVESPQADIWEQEHAEPPRVERPEWTELVASLRQDIKRRRVETQPQKQIRRGKKSKPLQDEWGFFDPEQCGFAALLAKLDEITEAPDECDPRRPS